MGGYYRDRSPLYDRGYRGGGGYRRGGERDIVREPPSRCSLLVRNLPREVRSDDIRLVAEKYGKVRDVYCPVDYYTREPKGIGFVEYYSADDAEEAQYRMDRMMLRGKEIQVVFAKQGRKRPEEYRRRGGGPPRRTYNPRSPPPRRRRSPSRSPRRRRSYTRSRSRSRSRSRASASRSRSPPRKSPSKSESRSRSHTPSRSRSLSRDRDDVRAADRSPREDSPRNDREPSLDAD